MLVAAIIVLMVLVAIALRPSKPQQLDMSLRQSLPAYPTQPVFMPPAAPQAPVQVSFREQMLSEEAAAIASAFRSKADEEWMAGVSAKAAKYFTP
jgi:hypothetical protein